MKTNTGQTSASQAPSSLKADIKGMHCASCVARVEKAAKEVPGVSKAAVNLVSEEGLFEFDPHQATADSILQAIHKLGYEASVRSEPAITAPASDDAHEYAKIRLKVIVGMLLSSAVMWLGMFGTSPWILLALTIPVQFWCGSTFLRGLWNGIKQRYTNMDTLVGLGTLSAFGYSLAATAFPGFFARAGQMPEYYYEIAAFLVSFVLLGKLLEARAKKKTGEAIRKLMDLVPRTARILRAETEIDIPINEVTVGDIVIIRPGERLPVDGIVLQGQSEVNESMLTGESIPIEKLPGSRVSAGTLNERGTFRFRATQVGNETALARIVELVKAAQTSKAPIQRYADLVSSYFVPAVLGISAITFITWLLISHSFAASLLPAVAVMVIACPCALGLATPTAMIVATGKSTERGILVRSAQALELLHKVDTIVFDKTGTLTRGRPEVVEILPVQNSSPTGSISENEALRLAASAESASEHLLGQAILAEADKRGLSLFEVPKFESVPGMGLKASVSRRFVLVGNPSFMKAQGIDLSKAQAQLEQQSTRGRTPVLVAVDFQLVAIIGIMDQPRSESREIVSQLRKLGIKPMMITGDHQQTARAIASEIGLGDSEDELHAEVLPAGKASLIEGLRQNGRKVVMVGDGVNDAPALAEADVGIAMGSGTDVAMETADITLMRGDLSAITDAIHLSRKTMRTIKQNLFASFFYNSLGIPVAAGILYPLTHWKLNPMLAGAAMALSSVSVILNSLRLKSWSWK